MHFTQGMGETGETYLVGPDGLMRSQSRFTDEPTLLAIEGRERIRCATD